MGKKKIQSLTNYAFSKMKNIDQKRMKDMKSMIGDTVSDSKKIKKILKNKLGDVE